MEFGVVDRVDVQVAYVKTNAIPDGVQKAFDQLEEALGSLSGKKFYGAFFQNGFPEYWACVGINDEEEAKTLRMDYGIVPGGKYATAKLTHWAEENDLGGKMDELFGKMGERFEKDNSRPDIEFYKSRNELVLLFPVR